MSSIFLKLDENNCLFHLSKYTQAAPSRPKIVTNPPSDRRTHPRAKLTSVQVILFLSPAH